MLAYLLIRLLTPHQHLLASLYEKTFATANFIGFDAPNVALSCKITESAYDIDWEWVSAY